MKTINTITEFEISDFTKSTNGINYYNDDFWFSINEKQISCIVNFDLHGVEYEDEDINAWSFDVTLEILTINDYLDIDGNEIELTEAQETYLKALIKSQI